MPTPRTHTTSTRRNAQHSASRTVPDLGVVYLIHFDTPYRHARHYIGWTTNLQTRLDDHRHGNGARLVTVITQAGIGWQLARTWLGGRTRERQIKRQGGASRCCPVCGVHPRGPQTVREPIITYSQPELPVPTASHTANEGRD